MNTLASEQTLHLLGWTMLHFLWIGAALLVIGALVRRALRSAGPSVRYAQSLATLVALAALPPVIATWIEIPPPAMESRGGGELAPALPLGATGSASAPPTFTQHTGIASGTRYIELNPNYIESRPQSPPLAAQTFRSPPPGGEGLGEGGTSGAWGRSEAQPPGERAGGFAALRPQPPFAWLAALDRAVLYLPYLWLIGTPITFALLATGLIGAERMRRHGTSLTSGAVHETCQRLRQALHISRRVSLAVCDRVAQPVLVGIVRPLILLPPVALTGWTPAEIEMVLLHELAHVRRWDNLVNLAQRVIESLLFFHPAVWIASTWVRRDREECCDAVVITRTEQPKQYAELLVALASPHPFGGLAFARHPLAARLRRILKLEDEPMLVSRNTIAILVVIFAVAAGVAYGPLRALADDQAGATPTPAVTTVDTPPLTDTATTDPAVSGSDAVHVPTQPDPPNPLAGIAYPSPREGNIAQRAWQELQLALAPATDQELGIARQQNHRGGLRIVMPRISEIMGGTLILTKLGEIEVADFDDLERALAQAADANLAVVEWSGLVGEREILGNSVRPAGAKAARRRFPWNSKISFADGKGPQVNLDDNGRISAQDIVAPTESLVTDVAPQSDPPAEPRADVVTSGEQPLADAPPEARPTSDSDATTVAYMIPPDTGAIRDFLVDPKTRSLLGIADIVGNTIVVTGTKAQHEYLRTLVPGLTVDHAAIREHRTEIQGTTSAPNSAETTFDAAAEAHRSARTYELPKDRTPEIEDLEKWLESSRDVVVTPAVRGENGLRRIIITATDAEHGRIAETLTDVSPKLPFLSVEDQQIADRAYRLLGIELEALSPEEQSRVAEMGFSGGLRVSFAQADRPDERQILWKNLAPNDLLVGMHIWPITGFQSLNALLKRPDLAQLSPVKFYVVRRGARSFPSDQPPEDEVVSGRLAIDADQLRLLQNSPLSTSLTMAAPAATYATAPQPALPPVVAMPHGSPTIVAPSVGPTTAVPPWPSVPTKPDGLPTQPDPRIGPTTPYNPARPSVNTVPVFPPSATRPSTPEPANLPPIEERSTASRTSAALQWNPIAPATPPEPSRMRDRPSTATLEANPPLSRNAEPSILVPTVDQPQPPQAQLSPGSPGTLTFTPPPAPVIAPATGEQVPQPLLEPTRPVPFPPADPPTPTAQPKLADAPPLAPPADPPAPTAKPAPVDPPAPATRLVPAESSVLQLPPEPALRPADPPLPQSRPRLTEGGRYSPDIPAPPVYRYDGKTFEQWRDMWELELSTAKRVEAVKAIAAFARAGKAKEAAETILDVAAEADGELLDEIAKVLASGKIDSTVWFPILHERFRKEPQKWQELLQRTLHGIRSIDDESIAQIVEFTQHEEPMLRIAALYALQKADPRALTPLIGKALQDTNPQVAHAAAMALYYQANLIKSDQQNPKVRNPTAQEFLPPEFIGVLFSTNDQLQVVGRHILAELPAEAAPPILDHLLTVLDDESRKDDELSAIRAIGALQGNARPAVERLEIIVRESQDQSKRIAAAVALDRIEQRDHGRRKNGIGTNVLLMEVKNDAEKFAELMELINEEQEQR